MFRFDVYYSFGIDVDLKYAVSRNLLFCCHKINFEFVLVLFEWDLFCGVKIDKSYLKKKVLMIKSRFTKLRVIL